MLNEAKHRSLNLTNDGYTRSKAPFLALFRYMPGILDATDPKVIKGRAIRPGAMVTITRNRSAMLPRMFVWIMDAEGNEQSVFRKALV